MLFKTPSSCFLWITLHYLITHCSNYNLIVFVHLRTWEGLRLLNRQQKNGVEMAEWGKNEDAGKK